MHITTLTSDSRNNRPPRQARRGFTLIELLAVLVILGVILSLIISVGIYLRNEAARKSTVATLDIIANAIAVFQSEKAGVAPAFPAPYVSADPNVQPKERSQKLYTELMSVKRSADLIAKLPSDALDKSTPPAFLDGYGNVIDYSRDGGVGNSPYVKSAGLDGNFGYNPVDVNAQKDDIRSDGKK